MYQHIHDEAHRQQWINASSRPLPIESVRIPPGVELLLYPRALSMWAMKTRRSSKNSGIPTLAEHIEKMDDVCKLGMTDWMKLAKTNSAWDNRIVFVMFHVDDRYRTELPDIEGSIRSIPMTGVQRGIPVAVALCTFDHVQTLTIDYLCSAGTVKNATLSMLRFIEWWAHQVLGSQYLKLYSMEGAWKYYVRAGFKRSPSACASPDPAKENRAHKNFLSNRGKEARQYAAFGGKLYRENKALPQNPRYPVYPIYSKCLGVVKPTTKPRNPMTRKRKRNFPTKHAWQ
jgi:hypothetical protein